MSDMPFKGAKSSRIKVWGRRRLRVLKEILPLVNNVNVRFPSVARLCVYV